MQQSAAKRSFENLIEHGWTDSFVIQRRLKTVALFQAKLRLAEKLLQRNKQHVKRAFKLAKWFYMQHMYADQSIKNLTEQF